MTEMADAESNALADEQAGRITHLSLHTDAPGSTGANEAAGGAPAYARQAVAFTAAGAEGVLGAVAQPATVGVAWSDQVTFDVPAGSYSFWGSWSALTGGNYRIGSVLAEAQEPVAQAQIMLSVAIGPVFGG